MNKRLKEIQMVRIFLLRPQKEIRNMLSETGERLGQAEEGRTFVNCQTGCGMRLSETLPPLFISFQNIPSTQSRLNLHTVRYPCLEQR